MNREFSTLIKLSVPLAFSMLSQIGQQIVNTFMYGQLGVDALAAGTLSWITIIAVFVFFIGLLNALSIQMSYAMGAKKEEDIPHIFQNGLYVAILLIPLGIGTVLFLPHFFAMIGEDASIVSLSTQFAHYYWIGVIPFILFFLAHDYLAVMGYSRMIFYTVFLAIVLNGILDKLLMGHLGIGGIALATALSDWIVVLILFAIIYFNTALRVHIFRRFNMPHWKYLKEMMHIGLPLGMTFLFESGLFAIIALMMGHFGTIALGAHQIVVQCIEIAFMILTGIAQATTIRIAYQMGAQQLHLIKYIAHRGLLLGLLVAIIFSSAYLLLPDTLTKFFVDSGHQDSVFVYARQFFFIAIFFQFFDALQIISNGMLRGIKDTLIPMFLGLSSYWVIGISAGWLFAFVFHWGAMGLWYGFVLGIASSGIMLYGRFRIKVGRMLNW